MKYLLIILAIVGSVTAFTLVSLIPKESPQEEIALTVNGHNIGEDIVESTRKKGYHLATQDALYDSIVTKELLIQEAQRQQIDREESFRKSLQHYYENSLVTTLLERRNKELLISVKDEEIDNYLNLQNKDVTFTRLDTLPKNNENITSMKGSTTTTPFRSLATPLKILLSTIQEGSFGTTYDTGHSEYAIRLDSVTELAPSKEQQSTIKREEIQQVIENYKREQAMNLWLLELKQQAKITIHKNGQVQ